MKHNEKTEFLEQMIEAVKEIPVEEIIGKEIHVSKKGSYYTALCPFHPDNHEGNFIITPKKHIWRCFACGVGGNGISFIMKYYDVNFLTACFKLALEYGLITKEDADMYSKKKFDATVIKHIEKKALAIDGAEEEIIRAPEDVIHNVYEALVDYLGKSSDGQLSKAHKESLLNERPLTEDELDDFFTFPTRKLKVENILIQLNKNLIRKYENKYPQLLTKELEDMVTRVVETRVLPNMKYVPGFFEVTDKDGNSKLDFISYKGIGFLIRDEKGHIKGIQVRKDKVKKGEPRYVWFSSSFASRIDGYKGGAPSKSSGGYIWSKKDINAPLCITEGRFKAEALAKIGYNAIYLSGVSSWKSILAMVDRVAKKEIKLVFDADILGNVAVYQQAMQLANVLKDKYKISFIVWSKAEGKGIDDLYLNVGENNIKEYCKSFSFETFNTEYDKVLINTLQKFNVETIREIKKEDVDEFSDELQKKNEELFLNRKAAS